MYKLMIAEDEALARDAIMRMIDFAAYGFEVVAVCEDGQQASEEYARLQPDLVITDINMPFVSGLELAARIDAAGLGTRVIIITGYDDFNYARQAIRSKVASYVLKPVTPDEFREVLHEARQALDEQVARQQLIRDSQRTIHRQNPLVRDQILNRIVQGAADIVEVAADLRAFGIDPERKAFLLSLVQVDQPQQAAKSLNVNEQLLRFMVLNVCEELAQGTPGFVAFVMPDGTTALLGAGERGTALAEDMQALGERIHDTIRQLLKVSVTVGVGQAVASLGTLKESHEASLKSLDSRFLLPARPVVTPDAIPPVGETGDLNGVVDGIVQQVRLQDEEQMQLLVRSLVQQMRLACLPRRDVQIESDRLVKRLLATLKSETGKVPDIETCLPAGGDADYLPRIQEWLTRFCQSSIRHLRTGRHGEQRRLSALAMQYIRDNHADSQLSLMQVCNHLAVSLSYFSTFFKEETGRTFIEFLTDVRMERAKELLLGTDQMLYAIAEQVGYENPAYFTVAFKKYTGMGPREFRKSFGREA